MAAAKRRKKRKIFSPVYLTLILIILYLPILMVVIYSPAASARWAPSGCPEAI